jgi:acid phosphatase
MPKNFREELTSSVSFINKEYHTNYSYPYGVSKFGDYLLVSKIHNKPLPRGMTNTQAEKIINMTTKRYLYVWAVPARSCIHSLDLMSEVEELFENKIHYTSGAKDLKYVLLTMHDTNITPLLLFLNYPLTSRPKYNAYVRFELFKNNENFYVRTKFNEDIVKICGQELCTYDEFRQTIHQFTNSKCNDFDINLDYLKHTGIEQNKE